MIKDQWRKLSHGLDLRFRHWSLGPWSFLLFLALGTEERRAVALHDAPYRRAAYKAGLAFAVVDAQGLLEVAGLAGFAQEVSQGGAAHFDGGGEDFLDGGDKGLEPGLGYLAGGFCRMDAGHEEGFAGVGVAHAHHDVGVHDDLLDGRGAALS